jgi:hypothetical protein
MMFRPKIYGQSSDKNISYFQDCFFETTELLNDPYTTPETFVSLWGVSGVEFIANTFRNTAFQDYHQLKRGTGITSVDAAYKVFPRCTDQSQPCESWKGNRFENLNRGIEARGLGSLGDYLAVWKDTFYNVNYGILLAGTSFGDIQSNYFQDMPQYDPPPNGKNYAYTGVKTESSTGFTVEDNEFWGAPPPGGNYGMIVTNSGEIGGQLRYNYVNNLRYGTQAERHNGVDSFGLAIECNDYDVNDYAILVNPKYDGFGGLKDQGTGCPSSEERPGNGFYIQCDVPYAPRHIYTGLNFVYYEDPDDNAPSDTNCITSRTLFSGYNDCSPGDGDSVVCVPASPFEASSDRSSSSLLGAIEDEQDPMKRSYLKNELVRWYLYNEDRDSAMFALQEVEHDAAAFIHCASLLEHLDAEDAEDVLATLPNIEQWTVDDYSQMSMDERNADSVQNDTWYELLEWWLALAGDSLSYYDANAEDIEFLQTIASLDNSASVYAEAMLFAIGVDTTYHEVEQPETALPKQSVLKPDGEPTSQPWLGQNIPNPFDESTLIPVNLGEGSNGVIEVFDLQGRMLLTRLVSGGASHVVIKAADLAGGVYLYRLNISGAVVATRLMTRE